jgi:hypothetical protein
MNTLASQSHMRHPRESTAARPARDTRPRTRGLSPVELAVLAAIVLLLIAGTMLTSGAAVDTPRTSTVRVESGQTLWDLARAHPVAGQTTAQTAESIARMNHLDGARVGALTAIRVPETTSLRSAVAYK